MLITFIISMVALTTVNAIVERSIIPVLRVRRNEREPLQRLTLTLGVTADEAARLRRDPAVVRGLATAALVRRAR